MRPVPILTYHSVSIEMTGELAPYTLAPERFRGHMSVLRAEGYEGWPISELAEAMIPPRTLPDRIVGLTFDDAFLDFETEALPVLEECGFRATLYAPTAYVGSRSRWLRRFAEDLRPLLTREQISRLPERGIECGAHSHTHPELDRLPAALLETEILGSKQLLEEIVGGPVSTFAYPFGYYSGRVRAAVERARYRSACATGHLPAWPAADIFALPRFLVLADTTAEDLLSLLNRPPYRASHVVERGKQVMWRMLRRISSSDGGRSAAASAAGPAGARSAGADDSHA